MTSTQKAVLGDTAVAALVVAGFCAMCAAEWWLVPQDHDGQEFDGFVLLGLMIATSPLWVAAWAFGLRLRRARCWWATPPVAASGGVFGGIFFWEAGWGPTPLTPWTAFAVVTLMAAAGCSTFVETLRPRLEKW